MNGKRRPVERADRERPRTTEHSRPTEVAPGDTATASGTAPADRGAGQYAPAHASGRGPTTAQLRGRMRSGRTIGKSNAEEPAAAPLDTDDEAAGRPPSAEAIDLAAREQQANRAMRERRELEARARRRVASLAFLGVMVIAVALIGLFIALV